MIPGRAVFSLGLSQLISWGVSYYLIGAFGGLIVDDLGWSQEAVYGGFSAALLVMGLSSSLIGGLIDRHGGRTVMSVGAVLNASGCIALALAHDMATYYAGWLLLGLGMRLTLYDAAFAALARIGGPEARRPMAQITLLGGLASTVFWPIGSFLAASLGWRGALVVYAGLALLAAPLHLPLPTTRHGGVRADTAAPISRPLAPGGRKRIMAAGLYAVIVTLTSFLNSGMSAHMIAILAGLGLGLSTAVSTATLRGVGQSCARLCEVLFGRRVHPLTLNLAATAVLPLSFVAGLLAAQFWPMAAMFTLSYGAGNGLVTITRGTLPLVLFDHRTYGRFVGRLVAPSFLLSAAAPLAYAMVITRFGEAGALVLSAVTAALTALAALALTMLCRSSGRD
ncbi:MFS transporter [Chelatococcus sp. SYSU_G07232]|uniref:MFS transporter n=1 Tax=Chelatococcus albus TaxID=3047466 RepID=A0ABT7ABI9_9HYPH|nr:MFS transporter [Chelatococcus sp. SYSU_G07232]MDJ1156737.1 MFS transporter [Chelatococcus sp. SYSU_G07232]